VGPQVIRAYLSRQHFEDVEKPCPMVALPTDVSRSDENAKRAFEAVLETMVHVLERSAIENRQPATFAPFVNRDLVAAPRRSSVYRSPDVIN
jgi:hypothetical protein